MGKAISLFFKLLVIAIILAVVIVIYQTCAGTAIIQRIDKTIPDAVAAPYEVATITHIYQAQKATMNDDKSVTMMGWYENIGGQWVYNKDSITLPPKLRPRINRR